MNTKAAALTGSILWGGSVLLVGLMNLKSERYGREFLRVLASIYPGYSARRNGRQVALAALLAAADGAIGGAITATLYGKMLDASERRRRELRAA